MWLWSNSERSHSKKEKSVHVGKKVLSKIFNHFLKFLNNTKYQTFNVLSLTQLSVGRIRVHHNLIWWIPKGDSLTKKIKSRKVPVNQPIQNPNKQIRTHVITFYFDERRRIITSHNDAVRRAVEHHTELKVDIRRHPKYKD